MTPIFLFSKERLLGVILVAAGLILNEWFLAATLARDGVIQDSTLRATVWGFNIVSTLAGAVLLRDGKAALERACHHARWPLIGAAALLFGGWVVSLEQIYTGWGLFHWIAADFGIYFAQAEVLHSGRPEAIYKVDALQGPYQALYDRYVDAPATATQVPYPPLFAWLIQPFLIPEPHHGFILWALLNGLGALYLGWRAAQFFPEPDRPLVALLFLTSYPAGYALLIGQPTLLLACAMAKFYLNLRERRDFSAGLFLSLLLIKPQYGVLLGLFLIFKRRWHAVAGAATGALIIVAGSIITVGLPALLTYPAAFTDMAQFRGDVPTHMINWRSLVLWLFPTISDQAGMMLTLSLSALTILLTALAWRGPWTAQGRRLPIQICLTIVATLLASHHSHQHGAVLLAVPLAAAVAQSHLSRLTAVVAMAACLIPAAAFTVIFALDPITASRLMMLLLVLCFGSLLGELWIRTPAALEPRSGAWLRAPAS